jgi:hypothetical protein
MYNAFQLIYSIGLNVQNFIINTTTKNIQTIKEKTTQVNTILGSQMKKYKLDIRILEWIMFYAKTSTQIKLYMNGIYNSNSNIRFIVDSSVYCCKCLCCILTNQRIQPFKNNWICTSVLLKQSSKFVDEEYCYNDLYYYINKNDEYVDILKESCDSFLSIVSNAINVFEGMITMKIGNQYINRVCFNNTKPTDFNISLPLVQSKHQFISVKYSHPRMKEPIFIDIDKEYYYAYNELFSPLFIKRYLEYQPLEYEFDMNYGLEIMDNDINTFVLTSKQYVLLVESTYTIKNIE